MNVYYYIAESNPDLAFGICNKYGFFQLNSTQELADCLEEIVASEGEDAFKEVMDLHPDKEVILELYDKKKEPEEPVKPLQQNANGNGYNGEFRRVRVNATGGNSSVVNQTNTYILVGALIVSLAIISSKKS